MNEHEEEDGCLLGGVITKAVDHSLTRFIGNLKLCEWENVGKGSGKPWLTVG